MSRPGGMKHDVGRLFCVGGNYSEHIRELGNNPQDRCILFMKPATSVVPVGTPVALPRGRGDIHHEVELVAVIGREGRDIPVEGALGHIEGVTLGLDLTLRTLQRTLRGQGHPWEAAKAFDHSAPVGEVIPYDSSMDLRNIDLACRVNGEVRQEGNTRHMLSTVAELVSIVSRTWRLLPGDLVFTGTPPGVGPVVPGDTVEIGSPSIGTFAWEMV